MAWECKVNQGFWARPWHVGYTKTGFIVQDVSLSASRAPDKYLGLFVGIPVTSGHLLNVIVLRPPLSRLIIVLSPLNLSPNPWTGVYSPGVHITSQGAMASPGLYPDPKKLQF